MSEEIQRAAEQVARQFMKDKERMCEAALQGGKHGVLIVMRGDGAWTMSVSPEVPYGMIYERKESNADN